MRVIGDKFLPSVCPKCNSKVQVKRGLMMYIHYCANCGWKLEDESTR